MNEIKRRTIEKYKKKKEEEEEKKNILKKINDGVEFSDEEDNANSIINKVENNENDNEDNEILTSDTNELSNSENELDSDDSLSLDATDLDENISMKPPYLYIDYDDLNIEHATKYDYATIKVDKSHGLTKEQFAILLSDKYAHHNKKHIIINCWKVLTKSNLNIFSFDCTNTKPKEFERKMESKIKWGSKPYLKDTLTSEERKDYSIFRKGVPELLKTLYHKNIKIFIVSNSDYSFIKRIFEYYRIDKYIEAFFTPSVCGLPNGKLSYPEDQFVDKRKMNRQRAFVCIERYIGRLPMYAN